MRPVPSTFRHDLITLRARADDLLDAPSLPPAESPWVWTERDATQQIETLVKPARAAGLTSATLSDSGLIVYQGAALGVRQVTLLHAFASGELLPPGFSDIPPRMLALMAFGFPALCPPQHVTPHAPLTKEAKVIVDAWEASGLGPWASIAFYFSHIYVPSHRRWVPLTPRIERSVK